MALKDEFVSEECFTLEQGTPTLTIEQEDEFLMVSWIQFRHATWGEEGIQLSFQGWLITIVGEGFAELWKELQLQNVRSISLPRTARKAGCVIAKLSAVSV